MSRGLRRTVVCAMGTLVGAALIPSVGQAWSLWTTNLITLDAGACGQMLQIGSDPSASSSATPTFTLVGDGGLSSYAMAVDGVPIGTFKSDGRNVCVAVQTPLPDGPHLLTGVELAPRPSMAVPAFPFSVDTVAPASPSAPSLAAYSDTGRQGDGITKFHMVTVIGTADPGDRLQIWLQNGAAVAGAIADSSRQWLASTTQLADGTYTLSAVTLDSAGNKSVQSNGLRLVVDSAAPAIPGAATVVDVDQDGRTAVGGIAADDVATIAVLVNGTQVGTTAPNGAHGWRLTLPGLDPGPVTVTVAAGDAADNWTAPSAPATVTIGAPAPVPPPQEPAPAPPPVTSPPAAAPIQTPSPPAEQPPAATPPAGEDRPAPPDLPRPEGRRPPPPRR